MYNTNVIYIRLQSLYDYNILQKYKSISDIRVGVSN